MVGIFGHQNLSDCSLGRQAALDQSRRRWGLYDFCTRSASSIAFSVSGSSGSASLGMPNQIIFGRTLRRPARLLIHFAGCQFNRFVGSIFSMPTGVWVWPTIWPGYSRIGAIRRGSCTALSMFGARIFPICCGLRGRRRPRSSAVRSRIQAGLRSAAGYGSRSVFPTDAVAPGECSAPARRDPPDLHFGRRMDG